MLRIISLTICFFDCFVFSLSRDGIVNKTKDETVLKSINMLRNKANEIAVGYCRVVSTVDFLISFYFIFLFICSQSNGAKYSGAPAEIDFASAQKKLKFTASAVDSLKVKSYAFCVYNYKLNMSFNFFCICVLSPSQAIYDKKVLPTYTANLPALEKKRRDALVSYLNCVF